MISLQSTVPLLTKAETIIGNYSADEVFWLRVLQPDNNWQVHLPKVWQLLQEFDICVLERLRQASLVGTKDYVLATRTSCSNGFRMITGHCYLSPAFSQLSDVELYVGEYLVDLLHVHFFGNSRMESSVAFG